MEGSGTAVLLPEVKFPNSPLIAGREISLLWLDDSGNSTLSSLLLDTAWLMGKSDLLLLPMWLPPHHRGAEVPLLSLGSGENTELPKTALDTTLVVRLLGRDTFATCQQLS